ncbi:MAG: Abi family protein [Eggerthellaceae bacterium]|nr:Abi family protein [Eggerthellaceae bacterium]
MEYMKPFKTFEEQADILTKERGMAADRDSLIEHLQDVGYYRLSGYWHIFKQEDNTFREGTTFEKVWDLYTFDRQFRLVVFDAIERVEVYFRTRLAYELAKATGPFGYRDSANLPGLTEDDHARFIRKCEGAFNRSREPFAIHFREKYGDVHALPPYWMLVNLTDFGMMLTLYRGASNAIRKGIAADLGVSAKVLESWLVCLNTVRNMAAHHGRLWNRRLGTQPTIPRKKNDVRWHEPHNVKPDRMFGALTVLSYLLELIAPDTKWRDRLFDLLSTRSAGELRMMGFAGNWRECPFWSPWIAEHEGDSGEGSEQE